MENIGSRRLAQVAIVVRDIQVSGRRWADLLGMPDVPPVIVTPPGHTVNQTFRGAASDAQTKLMFFELDNIQIELIEPMGGDSAWQEGLDARGEHVHHIAFWVEGMSRSASFLEGQGIPLIHRGDMGEGQFAYFDGTERLGVMVELLEKVRS